MERRYRLYSETHLVELPAGIPDAIRTLQRQQTGGTFSLTNSNIEEVIQEHEDLIHAGQIYTFMDYAMLTDLRLSHS
jgi:hypothetical protein